MSGRLLVIVTGASKGFGRCVAKEFARKVAPLNPVDLILTARSAEGLRSAADSIGEITRTIPDAAEVVVRQEAMDLGDMEKLDVRLDALFGGLDPDRYSRAVLINNAAFVGHVSFVDELPSLAKLKSEIDLNVTSAFWLSSHFTALFGARRSAESRASPSNVPQATSSSADNAHGSGAVTSDTTSNLVVNISSTAAFKPRESWGGYCAGKAARDMFHRVLAMEQASVGGLKVLNYAPGPMLTDMVRWVLSAKQVEDGIRVGRILGPKVSAEKCVRLALGGTFATGAHVDFKDKEACS